VLPEGVTTAGRDPESGIFLEDITVSRHHARFIVDEGTLVVEDLGSTNGTYVNGERNDRAELQRNDEVFIGKFRLLVARGDA
jgi:pSer/pThr/pTyr-binding forkhead associated (FHA) protein